MTTRYTLYIDSSKYWTNCNLTKDGSIIEENFRYYTLDENFICIYEEVGGQDSRKRGELRAKYCITDCEFKKQEIK